MGRQRSTPQGRSLSANVGPMSAYAETNGAGISSAAQASASPNAAAATAMRMRAMRFRQSINSYSIQGMPARSIARALNLRLGRQRRQAGRRRVVRLSIREDRDRFVLVG